MSACDFLVIGAGPAGSTAALRLARAGRSVVLVEKASFPRRKVCGEFISATTWSLLRELGVADTLGARAGPPVTRVALYARDVMVDAPMPAPQRGEAWGRAVGRHHLDAALRDAACGAGARVLQPATVVSIEQDGKRHHARITHAGGTADIDAGAVIQAHGSWERMPWSDERLPAHRPADLLGFKARFEYAALPPGLMPLVLFPGGYGGMVASDAGTVSLSCCIRRDALKRIRGTHGSAGDAVQQHVVEHVEGVRRALAPARREQPWLAAGPIRPGLRTLHAHGRYRIGNAAGEAHPLIAEGIAMAIQSAWLLADCIAEREASAGSAYARAWKQHLATRVLASRAFATLTMAPPTAAAARALLRRLPAVLTLGAAWSGKAHHIAAGGSA